MNISFPSLRANGHFLSILTLLACLHSIPVARAAVHQSWVQHWDGGFPAKANKPVAMKLDSAGNICILGSAANSSNLLDYVTFKYAPDGTLLWSKRYGTTNGLSNLPRSMALDTNDNIYVTGTSVTVKYSPGGTELWTAAYGGRDLSVRGTNLYVVGFSEDQFGTAKLNTDGITQWTLTRDSGLGRHISQAVVATSDGGAYVAGTITVVYDKDGGNKGLFMFRYDAQGNELRSSLILGYQRPIFQPVLLSLSDSERVSICSIDFNNVSSYGSTFNPDGSKVTGMACYGEAHAIAVFGDFVRMTGSISRSGLGPYNMGVTANGSDFEDPIVFFPQNSGTGLAISVDSAGNSFATGDVGDIAIMKCDRDVKVIWTQRYQSTFGRSAGTAIAAAPSGDVYVAGYSTLAQGGTEIVLLKYSEFTAIQKAPDGMLLQFPGGTDQQYKIQAATNFPNWIDIGLATTAPDGLVKFTDTNTTQHPFRFYQTVTASP